MKVRIVLAHIRTLRYKNEESRPALHRICCTRRGNCPFACCGLKKVVQKSSLYSRYNTKKPLIRGNAVSEGSERHDIYRCNIGKRGTCTSFYSHRSKASRTPTNFCANITAVRLSSMIFTGGAACSQLSADVGISS